MNMVVIVEDFPFYELDIPNIWKCSVGLQALMALYSAISIYNINIFLREKNFSFIITLIPT